MDIEQFRTLSIIAKEGSISKAAKSMHISQSALSQQIISIEKELEGQIFTRNNKGVSLTCYGELVHTHSKNIISVYDTMLQELNEYSDQSEVIRILATSTIYNYALPCALYKITNETSQFTLQVERLYSNEIEDMVAGGCVDIGIITGKSKNALIDSKLIFQDDVYLIAHYDLDIPNEISIEEMPIYPIIMLDKKNKTIKNIIKQISNFISYRNLNIPYYLDSFESIKVSVLNNCGIAFLPYSSIKKELYNKQLKIININDFILTLDYYIIVKKRLTNNVSTRYRTITKMVDSIVEGIC